MRKLYALTGLLFIIAALPRAELVSDDIGQQLLEWLGDEFDRAKLVYVRTKGQYSSGTDYMRNDTNYVLVGFDTETGVEDTIKNQEANYTRPLITKDGNRVVYSDQTDATIHIVNWDGTDDRVILEGMAGSLWYDSSAQKEYVVCCEQGSGYITSGTISKVNIDDPSERDTLHTGHMVTPEFLCLSQDGQYLGGAWPWPFGGMFRVPSSEQSTIESSARSGCSMTMPYDNSYQLCMYSQDHEDWYTYNFDEGTYSGVGIIRSDHLKFASYRSDFIVLTFSAASDPSNVAVARVSRDPWNRIEGVSYPFKITDGPGAGTEAGCDLWLSQRPDTVPRIDLTLPRPGDTLFIGDTVELRYEYNEVYHGEAGGTTLALSVDGGRSWDNICPVERDEAGACTIYGFDPFDKACSIVVPDSITRDGIVVSAISSEVYIRVRSYHPQKAMDINDSALIIAVRDTSPPPPVTIMMPKECDTWELGTQQTVSWRSTLSYDHTGTISLSLDGGKTWPHTTRNQSIGGMSNYFSLTPSNAVQSCSAMVKITSSDDPTVGDTSGLFIIGDPTGCPSCATENTLRSASPRVFDGIHFRVTPAGLVIQHSFDGPTIMEVTFHTLRGRLIGSTTRIPLAAGAGTRLVPLPMEVAVAPWIVRIAADSKTARSLMMPVK